MKTIATIAGSGLLKAIPHELIEWMKERDPRVLLRAPNEEEPGRFERIVMKACQALWIEYELCRPGVGGRGATFVRDNEMVGRSDVVLAFFVEMEMSGGTMHVVEAAQDRRVPVYAYGVIGFTGDTPRIQLIGSWDPDESWARDVL